MESGYLVFEATAKFVVSADSTRIYTDAVGHPFNPPIVFIHGYSLSSIVYDNIFTNPVRLDMRGHGRSDKPEDEADWTPKKFAEDFDSVVAAYQLCKPFIVAWSCGGTMIADIFGFHSHAYVTGIVYITPIPFIGFFQHIATQYARDLLPKLLQTMDINAFQRGAHDFVKGLVAAQNLANPAAFPPRLQYACLGDIMSQPRSCSTFALTRTQHEAGLLRAGEEGVPTLLINGKLDILLMGQPLLGLFSNWKNLDVVDMHTGHMPWWEAPEVFNDTVLGWISRVLDEEMER
ncbi:hypothetical protein SERLA73DRAFT_74639 [Serpula lacrymans var. lacrymans S7.3]|uniref:AB hydrolase-1 domain-containing protein n=2 Tax=Serpula lacrymans var. lacrymans TaxID=341189 RepID=F8PZV4_SERL3|nr:uncharacterized protein SERLADRAFT_439315 [Serpula lacrymans var. lacrymans S7.9]EGN98426.1 hypothetical protein SERLA73DRAFT_74639 [Serpula lacrymans var. lacrymans S7.3]EGO24008.1 hypothetical protein SERLADRAFT_439315 [Serpula lacrymans var. lacrymans S7.9]